MSIEAVNAISKKPSAPAGPDSPAVQSDVQVLQLKSQIKDWSTCPTTPPAVKKVIVNKLQTQLNGVVAAIENKQNEVQAANQASAQSAAKLPTSGQPTLAERYVPPFKVDTYV